MVRHLMYQNFIFLFIFGGGVSFLYFLLHKGNKYRWVSGGIASACAVVIVVYFLPFSVQMPMEAAEKLGGVSAYIQGISVDLTIEQKVAEVVIYGGGKRLSALFSMEEDGFNGSSILYGVTGELDRVLNPEAVINYLYNLAEE